jgi:hypothetical protein
MTAEKCNYRQQRVERLLDELRYEITRGMMEGELDEELGYRFYVPVSKAIPNGVVFCEFRARPIPGHAMRPDFMEPKLRVVK